MSLTLHFALLRRPLVVWLAVLIASLGALLPTLSHARAWELGGQQTGIEICSSSGPRWLPVSSLPDSPDGQQSAPALEHCPFCLLATDRVLPALHALPHLFAVSGEPAVPTTFQVFFYFIHYAIAPPPRGPPPAS